MTTVSRRAGAGVRRLLRHRTTWHFSALAAVVVVGAVTALLSHRAGHTQGDDFALYLRQARSLFDGDIGAVVADNRFAVLHSNQGFSPIAYPWGWPLLLSPFVHLWGLDYDRLKVIEVVLFATWLVMLHGIVRRRLGRSIALVLVAVIGTAPAFLSHTDQLLSEFPHLVAVTVVVWWLDRVLDRTTLLRASTRDLVVLGALVTVAFNVRREGIVLIGVIGAIQLVELLHEVYVARGARVVAAVDTVRDRWRSILAPYLTFAVTVAVFQVLLPTTLLPDNGNSRTYINERFGDYPGVLTSHLGIGHHPLVGVLLIATAIIGAVIGLWRRPRLDGPLVALTILTALTISTHFRLVDRYWFQVTPWVLYFLTVAVSSAVRLVLRRQVRIAMALSVLPMVWLLAVHVAVVPGDIADAQEFNDAGRVQIGPADPTVTPIYDAVRSLTPATAVIAFFRCRTMTLLTDRRSIQNTSLARIREQADYYAQRRGRDYWQPELTEAEGRALGFEIVWSDARWILWKVTRPA